MANMLATGLSRSAVEELSRLKGEPEWMLQKRLHAWEVYESTPTPLGRRGDLGTPQTFSRFKFQVLWMTVTFIDVMIIDSDTFTFLWAVFPKLRTLAIVVLATAVPLGILIWRADPLRVRRRTAVAGGAACLVALAGLQFAFPFLEGDSFGNDNYVSTFARSGVGAVSEFTTHGFLESDSTVDDRLKPGAADSCQPAARLPHIILVHDESSFDIRAVPGVKVPPGYGSHFLSFDGKARQ